MHIRLKVQLKESQKLLKIFHIAVIVNDDSQSAPIEQSESTSNNNQQVSQNTSSFRNFKIEVDL